MKEHIQKAYEFLSRIPVTGDNVDLMAAVRHELRMAFREEEEKDAQCAPLQGTQEEKQDG